MIDESMTSGRSVRSCTRATAARMSATSSASGSPTFTSSMSAPPSTCSAASMSSCERSPDWSWAWNAFRPVGLMRSPMTQNGRPAPIVTVLDRDWRTVSMLNPLFVRRNAKATAGLGDAGVLPEADEVETPDPGQRHGMRRLLVGQVEARLERVGRGLDPLDHRGRDRDPRHSRVDEAKRGGRAQDRDRREDGDAVGEPGPHRLGHERVEPLRLEGDLELDEPGARGRLLVGPGDAVLVRWRAGVLDAADEELRRRIDAAAGQVPALGDTLRRRDQCWRVEVE